MPTVRRALGTRVTDKAIEASSVLMPRPYKGSAHAPLPAFRTLFASNPLLMWVYDQTTLEFLEINQASVRQYGYSRGEFLAMRITQAINLSCSLYLPSLRQRITLKNVS